MLDVETLMTGATAKLEHAELREDARQLPLFGDPGEWALRQTTLVWSGRKSLARAECSVVGRIRITRSTCNLSRWCLFVLCVHDVAAQTCRKIPLQNALAGVQRLFLLSKRPSWRRPWTQPWRRSPSAPWVSTRACREGRRTSGSFWPLLLLQILMASARRRKMDATLLLRPSLSASRFAGLGNSALQLLSSES